MQEPERSRRSVRNSSTVSYGSIDLSLFISYTSCEGSKYLFSKCESILSNILDLLLSIPNLEAGDYSLLRKLFFTRRIF